jgi:hypothetical protein
MTPMRRIVPVGFSDKLTVRHARAWVVQRCLIPLGATVKTTMKDFFLLSSAWAANTLPGAQRTISPRYAVLNQQLHELTPYYGTSGHLWANKVQELADIVKAKEVLDYGCGKQTLANALSGADLLIRGYDPALPGLMKRPSPCDVVVCTDVLEHVEPAFIDSVLDDLARCTQKIAFVTVATRPAVKTLSDGRNAHLTVKPFSWWKKGFEDRFEIIEVCELDGHEFSLVLKPRRLSGKLN